MAFHPGRVYPDLLWLIISILELINFTDNFFFLLLTQHQNFLERTVGYTLGFLLLGIGFYHWVPGCGGCWARTLP